MIFDAPNAAWAPRFAPTFMSRSISIEVHRQDDRTYTAVAMATSLSVCHRDTFATMQTSSNGEPDPRRTPPIQIDIWQVRFHNRVRLETIPHVQASHSHGGVAVIRTLVFGGRGDILDAVSV